MTSPSVNTLAQQVLDTLKNLNATREDRGQSTEELFKAGTLPFGQLNMGLLELTRRKAISRLERHGVGYFHVVNHHIRGRCVARILAKFKS